MILGQTFNIMKGGVDIVGGLTATLSGLGRATFNLSKAGALNIPSLAAVRPAEAAKQGRSWAAAFRQGAATAYQAEHGFVTLPSGPRFDRRTKLARVLTSPGRARDNIASGVARGARGARIGAQGVIAGRAGAVLQKPMGLLAGGVFSLKALFSSIGAFLAPLSAILTPVVAVVGALAALFLLLRKRGESVGDTFARLGGVVTKGFGWLVAGLPLAINALGKSLAPLGRAIFAATEPLAESFQAILKDVFPVIGAVLKPIGQFLGLVWTQAIVLLSKYVFPAVGQILGGVGKLLVVSWKLTKPFALLFVILLKIVFWLLKKTVPVVVKVIGAVMKGILDSIGWIINAVAKLGEVITKSFYGTLRKSAGVLATLLQSMSGFFKKLGVDVGTAVAALRELEHPTPPPRPARFIPQPMGPLPPGPIQVSTLRPITGGEYLRAPLTNQSDVMAAALKAAAQQQAQTAKPEVDVKVTNDINLTSELTAPDGEVMARQEQKYRTEINERSGGKLPPYQQRAIMARSVPVPGVF